MKLYKKILTIVMIASTIFSSTYLICETINRNESQNVKIQLNENKNERYTIKAHNGKISVFEINSTKPIYTLDSPYIRDLPKYDQLLLNNGIEANSMQEVLEILEDYDN